MRVRVAPLGVVQLGGGTPPISPPPRRTRCRTLWHLPAKAGTAVLSADRKANVLRNSRQRLICGSGTDRTRERHHRGSRLRGAECWLVGEPLDEDGGGVVLQGSGLVVEDGLVEPAQRLRDGASVSGLAPRRPWSARLGLRARPGSGGARRSSTATSRW